MATSFKKKNGNRTVEMYITDRGVEITERTVEQINGLDKHSANVFTVPWKKLNAILDSLENM